MPTNDLQFRLTITCENDAFQPDPEAELARILRVLADRLEAGAGTDEFDTCRDLRDINGNTVGTASLKLREEHEGGRHSDWRKLRGLVAGALLSLLSLPALATEPCKVNVNAATPQELQLLARTGPVLSGRIVEARPLDAPKLDTVKGVGPSWLAVNGPHVAYTGPTTCTEKIRAPKVTSPSPTL